jgi:hypothetical protein
MAALFAPDAGISRDQHDRLLVLLTTRIPEQTALGAIEDLSQLVRRWRPRQRSLAEIQLRKRLTRIARLLRPLVREIDAMPDVFREVLAVAWTLGRMKDLEPEDLPEEPTLASLMSVSDRKPRTRLDPTRIRTVWQCLETLRQDAKAVIRRAPAAPKRTRGRGRTIDEDRDLFITNIALILFKHGVRPTLYRGGVFVRALLIVSRGVFRMPTAGNIIPIIHGVVEGVRECPKDILESLWTSPLWPVLWYRGEN